MGPRAEPAHRIIFGNVHGVGVAQIPDEAIHSFIRRNRRRPEQREGIEIGILFRDALLTDGHRGFGFAGILVYQFARRIHEFESDLTLGLRFQVIFDHGSGGFDPAAPPPPPPKPRPPSMRMVVFGL